MSTGLNCEFVELTPGQWYYLLQNWDSPANPWDWREYATAYGPFVTQEKGSQHLSDHHANPGGYGITTHEHLVESGRAEKWAETIATAKG